MSMKRNKNRNRFLAASNPHIVLTYVQNNPLNEYPLKVSQRQIQEVTPAYSFHICAESVQQMFESMKVCSVVKQNTILIVDQDMLPSFYLCLMAGMTV